MVSRVSFLFLQGLWFVFSCSCSLKDEKEENLPMARGKKVAQIFTEQFSQNFCVLCSTLLSNKLGIVHIYLVIDIGHIGTDT